LHVRGRDREREREGEGKRIRKKVAVGIKIAIIHIGRSELGCSGRLFEAVDPLVAIPNPGYHQMKLRWLITIILLTLFLLGAFAQQRRQRRGMQQRNSGKQHHFHDRNRDGIEDGFQHRYGRKRLRHLVEKHLPIIRQALSVPPEAELKMVCKSSEIPFCEETMEEKDRMTDVPSPPCQFSVSNHQTLTVFFTWSEPGGCLYRWYLFQAEEKTLSLEGTLIDSRTEDLDPSNSTGIQSKVIWKPESK